MQEKACEITEVISVPRNSRIFQITREKVCILNLSWNYWLRGARNRSGSSDFRRKEVAEDSPIGSCLSELDFG